MPLSFADPDWQARAWFREILAHHHAENSQLQRAAAAKGYEMPLAEVEKYARPFPGTVMVNAPNLNSGPAPAAAAATAAADVAREPPPGLRGGPLALAGLMAASSILGAGAGGVGVALAARLLARPPADAAAQVRVFWGDEEITPQRPAEASDASVRVLRFFGDEEITPQRPAEAATE